MIRERDGRTWTERTTQEQLTLFNQELAALSADERAVLLLALKEYEDQTLIADTGAKGKSILDAFTEREWERQPVDIETFVKDEYYLGKTCDTLYPKLLEDMKDLFSGGYRECVLSGSIGYGKTFFASIGMCRVLYELSCMRDPQKSYGLGPGSVIALTCFSVNEMLAMKVVFENITNKMQASQYFKDHFPYELTKKEMRFPSKKVWLAARASTDSSALGLNTIGGFIDECLHADARVLLADGTTERAEVLSSRGFAEIRTWDAVLSAFVNTTAYFKPSTVQACYEVLFSTGHRLRASGNHPVATVLSCGTIRYVRVDALAPGTEGRVYVGGLLLSAQVVEVTSLGVAQTFDVCVPGVEVCIADGVLVHNTNFLPDAPKNAKGRAGVELQGRAQSIYNTIQRRMKSRFSRQGQLPGMLFIVSSKKTKEDFTAKLVEMKKADPTLFVRDYAKWDVAPEGTFSNKRFQVLCGNENTPSKLMSDDEAQFMKAKGLDEGIVILSVPEEFRTDFENDLEGSIRDLGGISTVSLAPFIQRREKIKEAVDSRLTHPFETLEYEIGTPATFRWDVMARMTTQRYGERVWAPIISPTAPRHIHIDPSLVGDATGFAMSHIAGWKDVVRTKEGKPTIERLPIFLVDVVLRIKPPTGGEIDFGDVRQLVYALRDHGYKIAHITMDRWNSADALQQLTKKGFKASVLSVDTKTEPYEYLKTSLYENRVVLYDYPMLLDELRQLERDYRKNKIDHPVGGRKDLADAVAASIFTLSQAKIAGGALPILVGASHMAQDALAGERGGGSRSSGLPLLMGSGFGDMVDDDGWDDIT